MSWKEAAAGVWLGTRAVPHNPLPQAQDHLPAAYAVKRGLLSESEVEELQEWVRAGRGQRTDFGGEPLAEGEAADGPIVRQFWGSPELVVQRFPALYRKALALKDELGEACGLEPAELADVSFAQDIRHVTYGQGDSCPWHRDDPASHFNVIFMLSRPGEDFSGGELMLHPGSCASDEEDAHWLALQRGDAVIYSAPKTDHAVRTVGPGSGPPATTTRTIFLLELRRSAHAVRPAAGAQGESRATGQ